MVAVNFAQLVALIGLDEAARFNGRRVRAVRFTGDAGLDVAIELLQPEGHDEAGLAFRLCEEVQAFGISWVYEQPGGGVAVGQCDNAEALYLASTFPLDELERMHARAGRRYAEWPTPTSSRQCENVWAAIMLLVA
jgi:hypothetical protein